MSIKEIETAIAQLPTNEIDELSAWLERYRAEQWDQQIASDLDAGRLDSLISEIEQEYTSGASKPL